MQMQHFKIPKTHHYKDDIIREGDDRIYYNIEVREGRASPTGLPYAEFNIERSQPILANPKDYYLTITRFAVPVLDTPLMICPIGTTYQGIAPIPPAINWSDFKVCLSYLGVDFPQTVVFQTQTPTAPIPTVPGYVDPIKPYYYSIYSYEEFIRLVNIALQDSWNQLNTHYGGAQPQATAPYYIYDAHTQLISLICEYSYLGSVANPCDIYINSNLLTYIGNINGTFYGRNLANGKDFKYVILDNDNGYAKPGGTIPVPPLPPNWLKFEQEYRGLDNMNAFFDLVFTTNTLSVNREWTQTSNPLNLQPNQISLLTDFEPLVAEAGDSRSLMAYYPQGPYRLINLLGDTPLRNFDFKVWWKDKQGRLYPLTIPYKQTLSIKFLFIKKSTFTS